MSLRDFIRRWKEKPKVRPWALAAPILLLVLSLPLLRPLRHPASPASDEIIRLKTVQAIVETRSFAIDVPAPGKPTNAWRAGTVSLYRLGDRTYSGQPPVFAGLLAGPYWVMREWGVDFQQNPLLAAYLLTLLGTTLPAALGAGLVYRMARMFELPRWQRSILSLTVALGSGLGSYSTVLNGVAPSAALVLASAGCMIHWSRAARPFRSLGWLGGAGFCAALAAVIEPMAMIFPLLFMALIFALRVGIPTRLAGVLLFAGGAVLPLLAHFTMTLRIGVPPIPDPPLDGAILATSDDLLDERSAVMENLLRLGQGLAGAHGALSHFPVLLVGIAGVGAVMHRHWPGWVKVLAAATAAGAGAVYLIVCLSPVAWWDAMFACRWFVVFSPMVIFWCGAWMRASHSRGKWIVAGMAMGVSCAIGVIGMIHPWPEGGYEQYTVLDVFEKLHEDQMVKSTSP